MTRVLEADVTMDDLAAQAIHLILEAYFDTFQRSLFLPFHVQ